MTYAPTSADYEWREKVEAQLEKYSRKLKRVDKIDGQALIHYRFTPDDDVHFDTTNWRLKEYFMLAYFQHQVGKVIIAREKGTVREKAHFHVLFYSLIQDDTLRSWNQRFKPWFADFQGNGGWSSKSCHDSNMYGYLMKDDDFDIIGSEWGADIFEDNNPSTSPVVADHKAIYAAHLVTKANKTMRWRNQNPVEAVMQCLDQKGIKRPRTEEVVDEVLAYYDNRGKVMNPFHLKNVCYTVLRRTNPDRAEQMRQNLINEVDRF